MPQNAIDMASFAISAPFIVRDPGWDVPKMLIHTITQDRLIRAMKKENITMATLSEAMLYISNTSHLHPIGDQWTRIMQYCFTKTMPRIEGLSDVDELDDYDMSTLNKLRQWIFTKQVAAMKQRSKVKTPAKDPEPMPTVPVEVTLDHFLQEA